jgi:hypothetical protein
MHDLRSNLVALATGFITEVFYTTQHHQHTTTEKIRRGISCAPCKPSRSHIQQVNILREIHHSAHETFNILDPACERPYAQRVRKRVDRSG